ncbi:MAG: hypothetical protein IJ289_05685 [Clostridia bacterium]|nr:hypothetical protein [Clostridia bacterium]
MKKKITALLCILLSITAVFFFSSCNNDVTPGNEEPASEDDSSYMAESQGICVMSACRMESDTEDASLAVSEDIAGIVVLNKSEKTLQYAEITADFSDGTVHLYKISTLPPGEACFVAEENKLPYRELTTGFFGFEINNVAFFTEEPSVYADKLQFSGADGILNIKNISDSDITENIVVYYKDYENSHLASGVTYRVTVEGGLEAGEIKQVMASHYRQNASMIMFVQLVPAEVS